MKRKTTTLKYALALGLSVCATTMFSQNRLKQATFSGEPVISQAVLAKYQVDLEPIVSSYQVQTLNDDAIFALAKENGNQSFDMTLNAGGHIWDLNLTRFDVRSEDYKLVVRTDHGDVVQPHSEAVTYRGFANGDPNNIVFATISEGFSNFTIRSSGITYEVEPGYWYIEGAASNDYIIFNRADFNGANFVCGSDFTASQSTSGKVETNTEEFTNTGAVVCYQFNALLYSRSDLTTKHGGTAGVQAYLTGSFNKVKAAYTKDFDVNLTLINIIVSDKSSTDPPQNAQDNVTFLSDTKTWGQTAFASYSYDVAGVVITEKKGSAKNVVGESSPSVVCKTRDKIMWTSDFIGAYTIAHEWGHMFGCGHDNLANGGAPYSMTNSCPGTSGGFPSDSGCECLMCTTSPNTDIMWGASQRSKVLVSAYIASSSGSCKKSCVDAAPTAAFGADKTSGCGPLTVQFTDASFGSPAVTEWLWEFGDGKPNGSGKTVSHTFDNGGTYTVKLTAKNSIGSSTPVTKVITVDAPGGKNTVTIGPGNITAYGTDGGYDSNRRAMFFEVKKPVTLKSITVFTGDTAGAREFYILSITGGIVAPKPDFGTYTSDLLPKNSKNVVIINAALPTGSFALVNSESKPNNSPPLIGNIYRHRTGASYPLNASGGIVSIYGNVQGVAQAWYIAYGWEFEVAGCPVSIGELSKANSNLSVYPNPTNGVFNIQSLTNSEEKATIEVYSLVGQKVYSTTTVLGNNKTQTIDLTSNAKGIYMVRLITASGSQSIQKIVVE